MSMALTSIIYSRQTIESGTDAIPARRGGGLGGFDYYTLTYDDPEDG